MPFKSNDPELQECIDAIRSLETWIGTAMAKSVTHALGSQAFLLTMRVGYLGAWHGKLAHREVELGLPAGSTYSEYVKEEET